MNTRFLTFLLAASFLLFESCSKNPVTGRRDLMLMSTEQEIAMGKQSDPEIVNFFGLYEDQALQKFIESKGQEMAAISHREELNYEFKIVDSPVINAFAVPGGYVYFTRGIMAHFNNEAEFAGVLGHEIGHIAARHSAKQYSKAMLAQVGLVVGMVVSPQFAQFADIAQQGVGLLFLKFGRDAERQSDKLGVEYSFKIGYDAQEMSEFFQTLDRIGDQSGASQVPSFLSTHPDPANRERDVAKMAVDWKKKLNLTDPKVNRDSYLKLIDGLIYGEDPKQGFVENNMFFHPVLKFQYPIPANWAVQNSPQQVQMVQPDGKAMLILTLAQGESLEAAAQKMVQDYNLKVVESKKDNVNGLPALALVADVQPQQQQQQQQQQQAQLRLLSYLIQYGGNIYNILGVSALNDFNNYSQAFLSTMTNFKELNDPEKLNRKPDRIKIKPVRQNGTMAQALRDLQVKDDKIQELALLNGMDPEEKVTQGMLVKVVEK
ncbi:M48 family metalloprotease [soil metagenome]